MQSSKQGFITGIHSDSTYESHIVRFLPPPSRSDHLNGKAYYIRSRARPNYSWHTDKSPSMGKTVYISDRPYLAKFIIQRTNPLPYDSVPREDILIDSDEVIMMAVLAPDVRESITVGDTHLLASSTGIAFKFKFGMLTTEGGFMVHPASSTVHFSSEGLGDEWELVT